MQLSCWSICWVVPNTQLNTQLPYLAIAQASLEVVHPPIYWKIVDCLEHCLHIWVISGEVDYGSKMFSINDLIVFPWLRVTIVYTVIAGYRNTMMAWEFGVVTVILMSLILGQAGDPACLSPSPLFRHFLTLVSSVYSPIKNTMYKNILKIQKIIQLHLLSSTKEHTLNQGCSIPVLEGRSSARFVPGLR